MFFFMSYVRDYCHVVDLAKGHVHCMKVMFGPNSNKVWAYNLGTGRCKIYIDVLCRTSVSLNDGLISASGHLKLPAQVSRNLLLGHLLGRLCSG